MNPNDKDAFTAAWEALDKPEEIRNAVESDEAKEMLNEATGKWYSLKGGELKEVK